MSVFPKPPVRCAVDVHIRHFVASQWDILPGGREALDDILTRRNTAYRSLNSVSVMRHPDRIGSDQYNQGSIPGARRPGAPI